MFHRSEWILIIHKFGGITHAESTLCGNNLLYVCCLRDSATISTDPQRASSARITSANAATKSTASANVANGRRRRVRLEPNDTERKFALRHSRRIDPHSREFRIHDTVGLVNLWHQQETDGSSGNLRVKMANMILNCSKWVLGKDFYC